MYHAKFQIWVGRLQQVFPVTHRYKCSATKAILSDPAILTLDVAYITDSRNTHKIDKLIQSRKGKGDIHLVQKLWKEYNEETIEKMKSKKYEKFMLEACKIPNQAHSVLDSYGIEPKIVKFINDKRKFDFQPRDFADLCQKCDLLKTEFLGFLAGHKSYIIKDSLAELEQALIQRTCDELLKKGFSLISVPDFLPYHVIEGCGMDIKAERGQVYTLDPSLHGDLCLSGTSEMAIAGFLSNQVLNVDELPLKLAAVSRCYRAEISSSFDERGIYRVHQFTKVEMFGVTKNDISQSEALLQEFVDIQSELSASYGIHCQLLDMPLHELGAPAYRKFDIEAWMPGRNMFGEISSSSNCTDFQARRLNIKYESGEDTYFCHTVNGTACAVPRMLIALLETFQNRYADTINIPEVLWPYMNYQKLLTPPVFPLKMRYIKSW
ncbi:serine--tRNA ligase, mitochondrial-like [Artemia franciscana]|uniref:serine--tRNA ligase n=1 Tax=Artemia franciscana TaxID=6661 RepID=A0AA88H8U6_ARTSF|nr:hypothetical protein QYM36_016779 [Artemia franciscana]